MVKKILLLIYKHLLSLAHQEKLNELQVNPAVFELNFHQKYVVSAQ